MKPWQRQRKTPTDSKRQKSKRKKFFFLASPHSLVLQSYWKQNERTPECKMHSKTDKVTYLKLVVCWKFAFTGENLEFCLYSSVRQQTTEPWYHWSYYKSTVMQLTDPKSYLSSLESKRGIMHTIFEQNLVLLFDVTINFPYHYFFYYHLFHMLITDHAVVKQSGTSIWFNNQFKVPYCSVIKHNYIHYI